jgi:transcriptional regulator of acetoin/glycerol metabolism
MTVRIGTLRGGRGVSFRLIGRLERLRDLERQLAGAGRQAVLDRGFHKPGAHEKGAFTGAVRAMILCEGETFVVDESWLRRAAAGVSVPEPTTSLTRTLAEREREIIEAALAASRGRISGPSGAAARLGIPRQTLESKIRALKIDKHHLNPL